MPVLYANRLSRLIAVEDDILNAGKLQKIEADGVLIAAGLAGELEVDSVTVGIIVFIPAADDSQACGVPEPGDGLYAIAYKTCIGMRLASHPCASKSSRLHARRLPRIEMPSCLHTPAAGPAVCWT
jgi:hypothetical protein